MLIVVGAGIVFVAWSNTRRRKQDALERREVEGSTGKLKQELERTANEIIGRMEKHVAHLENILDESERNRTQLEGRVAELKKLLKKSEGQAGEIRDLLARLEDAGAEVDAMQRKMENLERRLNLVMSTPIQMPQPVAMPQMTQPPLINPLITQPIQPMIQPLGPPIQPIKPAPQVKSTTPPTPPITTLGSIPIPPLARTTQPPKVESEPEKKFDKILEETIAEPLPEEVSGQESVVSEKSARTPLREGKLLSPENKQPVKLVEADPVKIEATRKKLTEASAEMAANPPEELAEEVESKQTSDLKNKRTKRSKRDIRKAALEALKEVEKQNELSEPKKIPSPEKPKPPLKKESPPVRREHKIETTDSAIIKEMLLAGMTIEEISRETGLGRGAIELIQEMTRRQLDRK